MTDYSSIMFDYAILDESQAIKNATSNAAKAARLIRAKHRLALSGTPIITYTRDELSQALTIAAKQEREAEPGEPCRSAPGGRCEAWARSRSMTQPGTCPRSEGKA